MRTRTSMARSVLSMPEASRLWGAAGGAMPEGTVWVTRARRAACRQRGQAAAEPGFARREPPPASGARLLRGWDGGPRAAVTEHLIEPLRDCFRDESVDLAAVRRDLLDPARRDEADLRARHHVDGLDVG